MELRRFLTGRAFPIRPEPEGRFWFHSAPMPDGTRIRSGIAEQETQFISLAEMLAVEPALFEGRRVLDIGAADGFFSVAAAAGGAEAVTAIDCDYVDWPKNIAGLAEAWGADIALETGDFRHHTFSGTFDTVLFLGVLYHLEDAFAAFRKLRDLVAPGGHLVMETQMSGIAHELPIFELASDVYDTVADQALDYADMVGVSNYLFPNLPAVHQLAHMSGFDCRQAAPSAYSERFATRAIFVMQRLAEGERWRPPATNAR